MGGVRWEGEAFQQHFRDVLMRSTDFYLENVSSSMSEANMWNWLDFEIRNIKRVFVVIFVLMCMNSTEEELDVCINTNIFDLLLLKKNRNTIFGSQFSEANSPKRVNNFAQSVET